MDATYALYVSLVDELCVLHEGMEPAHLLRGGAFTYGALRVSVSHDPDAAPGCLIIHADFGPLPSLNTAKSACGLLEANYASSRWGRGYGLDPESGHVIYAEALPLGELRLPDLFSALERIAGWADSFKTSGQPLW